MLFLCLALLSFASPVRADAPSTAAPSTDAPSTDAPSTDAPSTDAPSTEAPSTDAPSTEAPSTDAPSMQNTDAASSSTELADDPSPSPAPLTAQDPSLPPSAKADDAMRIRLESALADALLVDGRVAPKVWEGAEVTLRCARDPQCLSRIADAANVRYVVFGQTGHGGPLTYVLVDGFDVRLGRWAGQELTHAKTEEDLRGAMPVMTTLVLDRLAMRGVEGEPTAVLNLGILAPSAREEEALVGERVPWVLIGASGTALAGLAIESAALALLVAAMERDQQAKDAPLQLDAYVFQEQRDLVAMVSLAAAAAGGGAFVFAAMGASYWLFETAR